MKRKPLVAIGSILLLLTSIGVTHSQVPLSILVRITKAEDERRWDADVRDLLSNRNVAIRKRAALAAGRIGNEDSITALTPLLKQDPDPSVRAMAAFALGEVESPAAADALIEVVKNESEPGELRARALEALGKIAAALPQEQQPRQRELGAVIRDALELEAKQSSASNQLTVLLGLTAALRSRPADAGPTIARFLDSPNARVRSDAANALARLRLKDGNEQLRKLLTSDSDANVRANATRVLGGTEDKQSYDAILARATGDPDSRVRVSAIRALASLKDARAAETLLKSAPRDTNELLEIATTLGRLLAQKEDQTAIALLRKANETLKHTAPEIELAFVRIAPATYLSDFGTPDAAKTKVLEAIRLDWRGGAGIAAGLGEVAVLPDSTKNKSELSATAESLLRAMLDYKNSTDLSLPPPSMVRPEYGIPDVLRALAAFKPKDLPQILLAQLQEPDVIVRATAADLLGDLPPSEEITRALISALTRATSDPLNDVALSALDSLAKQKTATASDALKIGLSWPDYVVRHRAAALLKTNGAGDFSSRVGIAKTRNTTADYRRALSRAGRKVRAVVTTSKGSFTMELLPGEAPLTVDNFIQLAQRDYFRGITIHRVVPNFVIQDGDPRGDGNGGPGYQIRCEINQVPYDRATLGMALSGKDTGGSQWFVTHAPQPHLDGGYTVFGRVIGGMEVVDKIARGDLVQSIVIR